jgi:hypothetical protein
MRPTKRMRAFAAAAASSGLVAAAVGVVAAAGIIAVALSPSGSPSGPTTSTTTGTVVSSSVTELACPSGQDFLTGQLTNGFRFATASQAAMSAIVKAADFGRTTQQDLQGTPRSVVVLTYVPGQGPNICGGASNVSVMGIPVSGNRVVSVTPAIPSRAHHRLATW